MYTCDTYYSIAVDSDNEQLIARILSVLGFEDKASGIIFRYLLLASTITIMVISIRLNIYAII